LNNPRNGAIPRYYRIRKPIGFAMGVHKYYNNRNYVMAQYKRTYSEGAEAANITGRYSPNNKLLKPEFEPTTGHSTIPKTEPMDELINFGKLASNITPGFGPQYAQSDDKQSNTKLVRGLTKRNSKLFDRDNKGKITIPGIHIDNKKSINTSHSRSLRSQLDK
jgi:hypothetical protein